MNGGFQFNLPPGRTTFSHLDAWDPVTGKRIWSYPYKYVLLASVLATAGDLVFTGDPEGFFFALDARTGRETLELPNGRGKSWFVDIVFRQWTAVHRHADRMAGLAYRRRRGVAVSGSAMAHGVNPGGIRTAPVKTNLLQIEIGVPCGEFARMNPALQPRRYIDPREIESSGNFSPNGIIGLLLTSAISTRISPVENFCSLLLRSSMRISIPTAGLFLASAFCNSGS